MVYTDAIKQQEAMMFMTKKQAQLLLLAAGVLMLLFGLWRGEADTVFSKAIRLCMECNIAVPFGYYDTKTHIFCIGYGIEVVI